MTFRLARVPVFLLIGLACVTSARADWLQSVSDGTKRFVNHVVKNTKRRNCWPKPFVCADREAVRTPFALMVANGWRRQNMLGDHHFVERTGELTEAGRLKVHWILTAAPRQHRIVYVNTAPDSKETAARVDNVQQLAARLVREGELPMVLETDVPFQGWPAARADIIGRKFESSIPEPRLPESSSGGEEQ